MASAAAQLGPSGFRVASEWLPSGVRFSRVASEWLPSGVRVASAFSGRVNPL